MKTKGRRYSGHKVNDQEKQENGEIQWQIKPKAKETFKDAEIPKNWEDHEDGKNLKDPEGLSYSSTIKSL